MGDLKRQGTVQKSPIRALLARPVAFHPLLARLCGSLTAGLMLSQAIYWSERTDDPDGWFWKTQEDWTLEISMSRSEQEGARKQLEGLGFMECCRRGVGARLYFRVNFERLEEAIRENAEKPHSEMRKSRILKCRKPAFKKSSNPECGKPAVRNDEKPQSESQEFSNLSLLDSLTTAETTADSTSRSDVAAIVQAMSPWGIVSDAAAAGLLTACRQKDSRANPEEVAEFVSLKGQSLGDTVRNPIGLLLTVIPGCFEGAALQMVRTRLGRKAAESEAGNNTGSAWPEIVGYCKNCHRPRSAASTWTTYCSSSCQQEYETRATGMESQAAESGERVSA